MKASIVMPRDDKAECMTTPGLPRRRVPSMKMPQCLLRRCESLFSRRCGRWARGDNANKAGQAAETRTASRIVKYVTPNAVRELQGAEVSVEDGLHGRLSSCLLRSSPFTNTFPLADSLMVSPL
jgi:hypothetical protein